MKINWKVLLAFVVVAGMIFWAITSLLPSSYSGSNLTFNVGSGPVIVTNPSGDTIPAQLVGTGSRPFSVESAVEGLWGSSERQGSGASSTQLFEFELPPGTSEFTVARGANVSFTADTATRLEATVNPLNADSARTTIVVAVAVVAGALIYIFFTAGHRWIGLLRRQEETPAVLDTQPIAAPASGQANRGRDGRMYSDS